MPSEQRKTIRIFYCYAHRDDSLRDALEKHLAPLKHLGLITTSCDREVQPGVEWQHEIDRHLSTADIILLLVSPNFIGSQYCYHVEMPRVLERHRAGSAHVIPIILRPVVWQVTPMGKLRALPTNGKPIVKWRHRDDAFCDVVQGVYTVVKVLREVHCKNDVQL